MTHSPDKEYKMMRTVWVCTDCHLTNAGYSAGELGNDFDVEPLNLIETGVVLTPGLLESEHLCESPHLGRYGVLDCGEEERDFDTMPCQGCGSTLAGSRYAMTMWESE